jgi:hypothetical protein
MPQKIVLSVAKNHPFVNIPGSANYLGFCGNYLSFYLLIFYSNKFIVVTKSYKYYFLQTSGSSPREWKSLFPKSLTEIKGEKR